MGKSPDDILAAARRREPVIMGVLNVTPDSFSDGGEFFSPEAAVEQALRMVDDGADVIDIGAESTRPGSERVPADEQIRRLEAILPAVCAAGAAVSIDTTLTEVAEFALDAGACIVNDVSAGRDDPPLLSLVAERGAGLVLMHMLGQPKDMQEGPQYKDVVGEVSAFLLDRADAAESAGVPRGRIVLDPGIGFGKKLEHNLALIAGLDALAETGMAVLLGPSRKRFIAHLCGPCEPQERLGGTIAACVEGYRRGAGIFRVHDVKPLRQALCVAAAVKNG